MIPTILLIIQKKSGVITFYTFFFNERLHSMMKFMFMKNHIVYESHMKRNHDMHITHLITYQYEYDIAIVI